MTKKELVQLFVTRKVSPEMKELAEYHQWLNYNPDEIEEKVEMLKMYLDNGFIPKCAELKNIYNWACVKSADDDTVVKSDDISIETFILHMRDEIFASKPSIFTRTSKWLSESGLENVPELVKFGSERMKRVHNIGPKAVSEVSRNLKKFYGISSW